MNIKTHNNKSAFTLVELAIALIIIGLITGGVVGAQSLIESAKRQALFSEINNYQLAVKAFKLEFDSIPGDMIDAYSYFGADCSVSENGCNGNGNKIIDSNERDTFFHHLYLSKILKQENDGSNPFHNSAAIDKGVYMATSCFYDSSFPNCFKYCSFRQITGSGLERAIISPKNSESLDTKYDNGIANTGLIRASYGTAEQEDGVKCTTDSSGPTPGGVYRKSNNRSCCLNISITTPK